MLGGVMADVVTVGGNGSGSTAAVFTTMVGMNSSTQCGMTFDDNNTINKMWLKEQLQPGLLIDRTISPIWYAVGVVGNILSAHIWLRRRMRRNNSSAIYLATLSINDTLFLLLHVLQELKYAWSKRTVDYPVVCELFAFVYLTTQYLAPTLVLGFTIERFIAVCYPYQVNLSNSLLLLVRLLSKDATRWLRRVIRYAVVTKAIKFLPTGTLDSPMRQRPAITGGVHIIPLRRAAVA